MSDVTRIVDTVFKVTGVAAAASGMRTMAGAARSAGGAVAGLVRTATSLPALLGAGIAAMGVAGLASLHSEAEDTSNVLAGMFSTFGVSSDFNQGLTMAQQTMNDIVAAAGPLPGEAQQYIDTFQAGFANFQARFGTDVHAAMEFSNQLTAVASSLNVPAQEISSGIARLTASRGGAGEMIPMWRRILPYVNAYRTSMHQSVLDTHSFNALSQQQRINLLANTTHTRAMRDMIQHASGSWSAMSGALASSGKMMARMATEPLFEAAKSSLQGLNDLLVDSNGQMTQFARGIVDAGRGISGGLIGEFQRLVSGAAGGHTSRVLQTRTAPEFAPLFSAIGRTGGGFERLAHAVDAAGGFLTSLGAAALPGVISGLTSLTDGFTSFLTNASRPLEGAFTTIENVLSGPLGSAFGDIVDVTGGLLKDGLTALGTDLGELAHTVANATLTISDWAHGMSDWLNKTLGISTGGFHGTAHEFFSDVADTIRSVAGTTIMGHAGGAGNWTGLNGPSHHSTAAFNEMMAQINVLTHGIRGATGHDVGVPALTVAASTATEELGNLGASAHGWGSEFAEHAAHLREERRRRQAAGAPGGRGGAGTVNDFRHSRFDISQKFAEGYSADRIAIAFAHDLEHVAEHRLQGNLDHAMTVNR